MLDLFILAISFGILIYLIFRMLFNIFSPRMPEDIIAQLIEVGKTTQSCDWYGYR